MKFRKKVSIFYYDLIIIDLQRVAKVVLVLFTQLYPMVTSDRIQVQCRNWEFEVGTMYVRVLLFCVILLHMEIRVTIRVCIYMRCNNIVFFFKLKVSVLMHIIKDCPSR